LVHLLQIIQEYKIRLTKLNQDGMQLLTRVRQQELMLKQQLEKIYSDMSLNLQSKIPLEASQNLLTAAAQNTIKGRLTALNKEKDQLDSRQQSICKQLLLTAKSKEEKIQLRFTLLSDKLEKYVTSNPLLNFPSIVSQISLLRGEYWRNKGAINNNIYTVNNNDNYDNNNADLAGNLENVYLLKKRRANSKSITQRDNKKLKVDNTTVLDKQMDVSNPERQNKGTKNLNSNSSNKLNGTENDSNNTTKEAKGSNKMYNKANKINGTESNTTNNDNHAIDSNKNHVIFEPDSNPNTTLEEISLLGNANETSSNGLSLYPTPPEDSKKSGNSVKTKLISSNTRTVPEAKNQTITPAHGNHSPKSIPNLPVLKIKTPILEDCERCRTLYKLAYPNNYELATKPSLPSINKPSEIKMNDREVQAYWDAIESMRIYVKPLEGLLSTISTASAPKLISYIKILKADRRTEAPTIKLEQLLTVRQTLENHPFLKLSNPELNEKAETLNEYKICEEDNNQTLSKNTSMQGSRTTKSNIFCERPKSCLISTLIDALEEINLCLGTFKTAYEFFKPWVS
jgi:hypothetical protein